MKLDTLCPPEQAYSKALSLIEQSVRTPDFLLKKQGGVPDYGVPMQAPNIPSVAKKTANPLLLFHCSKKEK